MILELAEGVNTFVVPARRSTVSDMPVLVSPTNARKLSVLRSVVGVGLAHNEDGVRIYKTGAPGCVSDADAEKQLMASDLFDGNRRMRTSLQVGFTADCSTCSGRDTLTVGAFTNIAATDKLECALWLPPQALVKF